MSAGQLRQALVDAGLNVKTWFGWSSRGNNWAAGKPVGVMQHHTAPPVPFPLERLSGMFDGRIKCNINVKQDGTVWLVAFNACNFSSGAGSSTVLQETRHRIAPSGLAAKRGLVDNIGGNAWYWNFENDHLGDGSPIPQVQHDAIVLANRVVNEYFGLVPNQTIAHAEWTRRKIDPKWNSQNAHQALHVIREELLKEDDMTVADIFKPAWNRMVSLGIFTQHTKPKEAVTAERLAEFLRRFENHLTRQIGSSGGATVDEVLAEIKRRL